MRGFENHEVPRGIFELPSARLHSLRRPVAGATYICAERVSLSGVVHLPSIWEEAGGAGLTPRCNCSESLEGWCRHTLALAALWMRRPWAFDTDETAPTTPIGGLEPCRRSSPALDRLDLLLGLALQQGLARAPLVAELTAIAVQAANEGLDRMAARLATCALLCRSLSPEAAPEACWEAVEQLLEALRAAATIRGLMARDRVVEAVHDEWLGSITGARSSMPVRHRRYLEVGRSRFPGQDGRPVLKRYWADLASGEVVSDELPEEERVAVEGGAQLLRLRRGELHPGFVPRWLEPLSGQEEPAGPTEVGEALDHFLRGNAAALGAWKRRLGLDHAPEYWVGGLTCVALARTPEVKVQLADDRRSEPLPLGGGWPTPDDLPSGVIGAFGRIQLTAAGPTLFPLSLLTGEQVLLAPADLPLPNPSLLARTAPEPEAQALAALLDGLLHEPPAPPSPAPGPDELLALWTRVRAQILARLLRGSGSPRRSLVPTPHSAAP